LNVDDQAGTLLKSFYDKHNKPTDPYYDTLLHPVLEIKSPTQLDYFDDEHSNNHQSSMNFDDIMAEINGDTTNSDHALLLLEENKIEANLINVVTQTDTPMQEYLRSQDMENKVDIRNFKSIDITNSPDGKLYKMVQSNPDDKIDKVVLFGKNQQDNFLTTEFNPLLDTGIDLKTLFPDTDDPIGACLAFDKQLPDTFQELQAATPEIQQKTDAFFKLLARGDDVYNLAGTDTTLFNVIKNISTSGVLNSQNDYTNYVNNDKDSYKNNFLLQNKGYRYNIN
jgi:hypothetical protein